MLSFAHVAALYREALISNTPAYRYLCFHKVLESSRKRREDLVRKLKKQYRSTRFGEIVPSTRPEQTAWLNSIFTGPRDWNEFTLNQVFIPEARGKKLTALFDGPLHGILDSGSYLHFDDPVSTGEVTKWLPLLRCAVRRTLKNDFPEHYLRWLREDGTVAHDSLSTQPR
jgi:hypothetical protein